MELDKHLKLAGLNQSEITVYLYLLENGLSSPPDVSHGTKITRTNCYNILNELISKGLIQQIENGLKKNYCANEPASILKYIENKKQAVELIMPQLREISFGHKYLPKCKYHNGLAGIQEILFYTMHGQEVISLGFSEILSSRHPTLSQWYKNELAARSVTINEIMIKQENLDVQNDNKFLPMLIWNNKIAFIALSDRPWGLVITNSLIAGTIRNLISCLKI